MESLTANAFDVWPSGVYDHYNARQIDDSILSLGYEQNSRLRLVVKMRRDEICSVLCFTKDNDNLTTIEMIELS